MNQDILLFLLISVIVLAGILYLVKQSGSGKPWKKNVRSRLIAIETGLKPNASVDTLKSIIIDTDKLLDYTLKMRGFKGDTMGDRLKSAKTYFNKDLYNGLWEAHKLRNNLVHEFNYIPNFNEVKRNFYNFKTGLLSLI